MQLLFIQYYMITTAILGASGYSGAELLRLMVQRNDISIDYVFAGSSSGKTLSSLYPSFMNQIDLTFEEFDPVKLQGIDVVFLALPSGEAMKIVPRLLPVARNVIDLSGDFRLHSVELYEQYYRHQHTSPELLNTAIYGLPELNKKSISKGRFIANPGCYPTSAILALLPAVQSGLLSPHGIVINSLSGVSGAGRQSSFDYSFTETNENVRAYKLGQHQHIPEMQSVLATTAGKDVSLSFVPHLIPVTRGIYTTIHANLTVSVDDQTVQMLYAEMYKDCPFIRLRSQVPQIKDVVFTNFCDIHIKVDQRTNQLIVISVIDNLVKGAAGQAMQNMNIMLQLPETEGFIINRKQNYVSIM